jgi:hypothetical protein
MTTETRWTVLSPVRGGAAFASGLRRNAINENRRKAELHEWENEGGSSAPPSEADATPS